MSSVSESLINSKFSEESINIPIQKLALKHSQKTQGLCHSLDQVLS